MFDGVRFVDLVNENRTVLNNSKIEFSQLGLKPTNQPDYISRGRPLWEEFCIDN